MKITPIHSGISRFSRGTESITKSGLRFFLFVLVECKSHQFTNGALVYSEGSRVTIKKPG